MDLHDPLYPASITYLWIHKNPFCLTPSWIRGPYTIAIPRNVVSHVFSIFFYTVKTCIQRPPKGSKKVVSYSGWSLNAGSIRLI